MSLMRIQTATIEVHDYESLLWAWREHGKQPLSVVGRFVLAGPPLTKAQHHRLPKALKEVLHYRRPEDDSVEWLERLYRLEDPRD